MSDDDRILANYGAMEAAVVRMNSIETRMESKVSQLNQDLLKMGWEGGEEQQFKAHQQQWTNSMNAMKEKLRQIARAVEEAQANYLANERAGEARWGG